MPDELNPIQPPPIGISDIARASWLQRMLGEAGKAMLPKYLHEPPMRELPADLSGRVVQAPWQQRLLGAAGKVGQALVPEYLHEPPVRDLPADLSGKVPTNQLDPGSAAAFGLIDLATTFTPAGVAKGAIAAGAGVAARQAGKRAPRAAGSELGAILRGAEAQFPQYAERYPAIGPPVEAIDPKSGQPYLQKALTPEAEEFKAARTKIAKDVGAGNYEPYFDPSKRFYPDPANYPPNVDTRTIVPKKEATIAKDMGAIGSDEVRAQLQAAYARGKEMADTGDWYAMGQLEEEFVKELGPEAGRKAFQDRFATSMASTTGGADPTSNLLMAQYHNYLRQKGLPTPSAAHEMPFPIGGRYATGNMQMAEKISELGGFTGLGEANPKRHNFAQNFMGNRRAATMDEQMTSGMTPGLMMPPPGKYGLYEQVLAEEAAKAGVDPMNFQEVGWAGFKNLKDPKYTTGKPMIKEVNEAIERTHRLTGMPRQEIVRRGLVRSEIPIYGVAGAAALPMLGSEGDR